MNEKLNQIIEAWELGNNQEREEFLMELNERYGFQRICLSLSLTKFGLMKKLSDEEIDRRFPVSSKLDSSNTY
jgi:hypothetical protein